MFLFFLCQSFGSLAHLLCYYVRIFLLVIGVEGGGVLLFLWCKVIVVAIACAIPIEQVRVRWRMRSCCTTTWRFHVVHLCWVHYGKMVSNSVHCGVCWAFQHNSMPLLSLQCSTI